MELMDISLKMEMYASSFLRHFYLRTNKKIETFSFTSHKLQENILHSFNRNMYSKNTHASNLIKEYNKILEKNVKYL